MKAEPSGQTPAGNVATPIPDNCNLLAPPLLIAASTTISRPAPLNVWGGWATMGLGVAIIFGMIIAQSVGVGIFVLQSAVRGQDLKLEETSSNGLMLSLATLVALPVTFGLTWLFAWVKAKDQVREYLGLKCVGLRAYLWGLGGLVLVMLTWLGMTRAFNIEEVPPFMVDAYRTADIYPLIWFAIIIAAPIMEEMLFRGFLFTGLLHSRLGAAGAIVITSVIWALIHLQYGVHEIVLIFIFGLLLGALRLKCGSILPTMFVHAVSNLWSTIEVSMMINSTAAA